MFTYLDGGYPEHRRSALIDVLINWMQWWDRFVLMVSVKRAQATRSAGRHQSVDRLRRR